jgi:hypothetical protein
MRPLRGELRSVGLAFTHGKGAIARVLMADSRVDPVIATRVLFVKLFPARRASSGGGAGLTAATHKRGSSLLKKVLPVVREVTASWVRFSGR